MESSPVTRSRVLLVALFAAAVFLGACSTKFQGPVDVENAHRGLEIVEPGTLTCIGDLSSPPMGFVDDKGAQRGFEVDLAAQVASRLSLKSTFIDCQSFTEVDDALVGHTADMGASAITLEDVNGPFDDLIASTPYMSMGRVVIMAKGADFLGLDSLNDPSVSIVVQAGSTNEQWVRDTLPKAKVVALDDSTDALNLVDDGSCTAAVFDDVTGIYLTENAYSSLNIVYTMDDVSRFCFAFSAEDVALRDAVNEALDELKNEGYIESLEVKWFGKVLPSATDDAA